MLGGVRARRRVAASAHPRPPGDQLKHRVLIADHEPHARRALEVVIRESGLGLTVVGSAQTGDELIVEALATAPHVVILEARLPKRSGLDALEELRRLLPGVQAIVVSRSDRFEDAARAVELGAVRYLLKPLEPARLLLALDAALAALAPRRAAPARRVPAPPGSRVCAFAIPPEATAEQLGAAVARLERGGLEAVLVDAAHAAFALPPDPEAQDLALRVRRALPGVAQLGVGDSVEAALAALDGGYFVEGEAVLDGPLPAREHPVALERELTRSIVLGDLAGAGRQLAALRDALMRPGRSARNRFRDVVTIVSRAFATRAAAAAPSLAWADEWSARVAEAPSAAQAARQLDIAWEAALRDVACRPGPTVTRAQEFIRSHATDHLTVSDVAAAVGFHPDYLSHLFRQELDMTVGSYLAACRLERAKELLTSSSEPIASVAASAGFADPRYFSRFFRRETGMSPRDYRRVLAAVADS